MIAIGVDGLSRGELHLGALQEGQESGMVPLHLDPIQQSPMLLDWLTEWMGSGYKVAEPADWFYSTQQAGEYSYPPVTQDWIWPLPPAAALTALEELGNGQLK